jgi:hypothetical protein
VYQAISYSFTHHANLEGYLRGAGFVDTETSPPEFLCLVKASNEIALRQARRHVVFREGEEDEDEEADRGVVDAQEEVNRSESDLARRRGMPVSYGPVDGLLGPLPPSRGGCRGTR